MNPSRDHGVAETIHLTEQSFDEALAAAQGLVMVDFWAAWCGPCRAIAPVLEQIAEASEGRVTLMKVNVDENPGLAARYDIRSIPTVLFVKQGTVVDRIVGAVPRALVQDVVARLRTAGLGHIPVVVGGIIPPEDARKLEQIGIAAVYTPKDFDLNRVMADVLRIVEAAAESNCRVDKIV